MDMDSKLDQAAKTLQATRAAQDQALDHARHLTIQATQQGYSQLSIATRLGVARTTVRAWLDK